VNPSCYICDRAAGLCLCKLSEGMASESHTLLQVAGLHPVDSSELVGATVAEMETLPLAATSNHIAAFIAHISSMSLDIHLTSGLN